MKRIIYSAITLIFLALSIKFLSVYAFNYNALFKLNSTLSCNNPIAFHPRAIECLKLSKSHGTVNRIYPLPVYSFSKVSKLSYLVSDLDPTMILYELVDGSRVVSVSLVGRHGKQKTMLARRAAETVRHNKLGVSAVVVSLDGPIWDIQDDVFREVGRLSMVEIYPATPWNIFGPKTVIYQKTLTNSL